MTQRTLVERQTEPPATNAYGEETPVWTAHLEELACWIYTRSEIGQLGSEKTLIVEEDRMIVPAGTDVTVRDRVNGVTDRIGRDVRPGIFRITAVVDRQTHLELGLEAWQL